MRAENDLVTRRQNGYCETTLRFDDIFCELLYAVGGINVKLLNQERVEIRREHAQRVRLFQMNIFLWGRSSLYI